MVEFIEAIAHGDFSAILSLVTTILAGGFGTALTIIAGKFVKYKASVEQIVKKVKDEVIPVVKETLNDAEERILNEVRKDSKVLLESLALLMANDKQGVIKNISAIGVSKEVVEKVEEVVHEEEIAKEEQKKEIEKVVATLESNLIETL